MHTTVFERLLAMTRDRGNIGFLMYVADAIGYLGYVAVMLGREILKARGTLASGDSMASGFVEFFFLVCWLTCGVSLVCLALSWRYFAARGAASDTAAAVEVSA
jgi:hypothetical protein